MAFSPTVLGSGLTGFAFLQRTRAAQQALLAQSPQIERNTQAVQARLEQVQTADQLLNDRALLTVTLGAFGLDEDIGNRAFLERILNSDLSDDQSLANRLADKRYREFAQAFNFSGQSAQMPSAATKDAVLAELSEIDSADDLLTNPRLLRASLERFGLEGDMKNVFFLQRVLESDPDDPDAFANRLSDPRYAELSRSFGLGAKIADQNSIYGFANKFSEVAGTLQTPSDLLNDPALLTASLAIFGLDGGRTDSGFLTSVLMSDLGNGASFANQLDDPRYAAWADVFGFAERAGQPDGLDYVSKLEKFVETVNNRQARVETADDLLQDARLMLSVFDFFDIPLRSDSAAFAKRLLTADPTSPTSAINVLTDPRLKPFVAAMNLQPQPTGRTYSPGFAGAIVANYLDRQFEIEVGNTDPNMRLALGLERDLAQVLTSETSNDARWYSVLASNPLREVFETALKMPEGFGLQDIDRQLVELKRRTQQSFGTDQLAELILPDTLDALRNQFLLFGGLGATTTASPASSLLSLLS